MITTEQDFCMSVCMIYTKKITNGRLPLQNRNAPNCKSCVLVLGIQTIIRPHQHEVREIVPLGVSAVLAEGELVNSTCLQTHRCNGKQKTVKAKEARTRQERSRADGSARRLRRARAARPSATNARGGRPVPRQLVAFLEGRGLEQKSPPKAFFYLLSYRPRWAPRAGWSLP